MRCILQHDMQDCGTACLAMIAEHYGLRLPLATVRKLTKTDKLGTSIYGLVDGAEKIGLRGDGLQGEKDDLLDGIKNKEIQMPFIAHIVSEGGMLHFVVVYAFENNTFYIADPAKGKIKKSADDFFKQWTGYIAVFEKTDEFREGDFKKKSIFKYFKLLKGQYGKLWGIFAISAFMSLIGIAGSMVFQFIIDNFSDSGSVSQKTDPMGILLDAFTGFVENSNISVIFIALIGLYLLQAGIRYIRGQLIVSIEKRVDTRLMFSYYNHIMHLPVNDILLRQTGDYMSRFADTSIIRDAISSASITVLLNVVMAIGAGVVLFLENSTMFFVSFGLILLYMLVALCFKHPIKRANRNVMERDAILQSYLKETIDGVETVKAANGEDEVEGISTEKFDKFILATAKSNMLTIGQNALAELVELVGTAIILWIGFSAVILGQMTLGALISFYALLAYFVEPVKMVIELQPQLQAAGMASERLDDILDLAMEEAVKDRKMPEKVQKWEFKNVDFRYGNRELVLKDLNISVARGEKIALVGESGGGKTTVAKLLLGFYEPERGSVLVDGEDIRNIGTKDLRSEIAYVNQNTFLFANTIKNNLKLGNQNVSDEDMIEACKLANAHDYIMDLPLGYDSPILENGSDLSGGQRQRLAIARALLRKPQLLILDEATSNLDSITESAIKNAIFDLSGDMSCVIIAHRLSTIRSCDKIYVINKGEVVEQGTHDELLKLGGRYHKFWMSSVEGDKSE